LFIASSTGTRRAPSATKSSPQPSSGCSKLIVGGTRSSATARAQTIASSAEAEPMEWPIIDLTDDTGTSGARSPNNRTSALTSIASLVGVPVPWALT
jgi:hypothetical protein